MMKYIGFYWNALAPMIKHSMKKRFGKETADRAVRNGKAHYRYILNNADDLGAHNPLASNAYFAYAFVGAWLGCDKEVTPDQMGDVMGDVLLMARFLFNSTDMNKQAHIDKYKKTMLKYTKWAEINLKKYPASWEMCIDDVSKGFAYHFTRCPIASTCKKLGMAEIMLPLCETDHIMAAIKHGKLKRKHTIAAGGEICDYWFVGDKEDWE